MNKAALLDAAERVAWTFAQAFLGVLVASPIFDQLGLDWEAALKIALFAGLASVAKSLLAIAISQNGTPQLGPTTYDNKPDSEVTGLGG